MKLCKDCKHVLPSFSSQGAIDSNARCAVFKGPRNPVTGDQDPAFAQNSRENPNACGMEARMFVERFK